MKLELEQTDLESIAQEVAAMLRPILSDNTRSKTEDDIFDIKGLAGYLKVKTQWIYERTARNEIPFFRLGALLRFRRRDIDKWLEGQHVPSVV